VDQKHVFVDDSLLDVRSDRHTAAEAPRGPVRTSPFAEPRPRRPRPPSNVELRHGSGSFRVIGAMYFVAR